MTKKRFGLGILVLAILFGITFIGCDDDPWDGVEIPMEYRGTWSNMNHDKEQVLVINVNTIRDITKNITYNITKVELYTDYIYDGDIHLIFIAMPPYEIPSDVRFYYFRISDGNILEIEDTGHNAYDDIPLLGEFERTD